MKRRGEFVKMWTCPEDHACHQNMSYDENKDDNVTCFIPVIEIDGRQNRRSKYHFDEEDGRCHDCIKHGGIHHTGCDVKRPDCDDQLISCGCKDKAHPILSLQKLCILPERLA